MIIILPKIFFPHRLNKLKVLLFKNIWHKLINFCYFLEQKTSNESSIRFPKLYSTPSNLIPDANPDALSSVFSTNTTENLTTSALFNPSFEANQSALLKFPYVGYENLYMRSGATNYAPYQNGITTGTENALTNHSSLTASYVSDPSAFYYHNVAQSSDYSALNPSNAYF